MPITRTPMIDDDGSGTTGTILNNAWKQELYNQIDGAIAPPPWVDRVFDAGRFAAAAGVWAVTAGNVSLNSYVINGKTITFSLGLSGTSLSASATYLICHTHDFLGPSPRSHTATFHYWCSGYSGTGYAEFRTEAPSIWLFRDVGGTPFAITSNLYIRLTITGSIQGG